jgi:hypothetical protein
LELAQSYLDKGNAEKALHQARDLLSSHPRSPDVLLLAARAATARGLPAEALHRLEQLDAVHGLDREQRRWYAGQLREAGRLQKALAEYAKLLKTARSPDRELLEAVGDLRYDTGDYEGSLSAYQRLYHFLPAAESRESLLPKLGRAADKAGDFQTAAEYYEGYAAGKNEDFKAQLEVARFYAGNSEHQKALPYYMKAVDLGGEEGLALEIAKTASGAGNPYLTERFAEYALRHGQEPEEAALLYAQALHSQERYAEETEFLRDHIDNYTRHAQAYAQLGYAAKEQDRLLEAKRLFGKAKSLGAEKEADLTYWQGESSRGRGDYGRATAFLRQAAEQGVREDLPLDKSLKKLERETATRLGLGGSYYEDTNHLQVWMGKLYSKAWLHENHLAVSAQYSAGRATQKEAGFNRHAFALDLGPVMPRDNWEVEAQGGLEIYENLENIQPKDAEWTGRLSLRRFFESSSFVGVEGYRETFWLKQESPDPRYFNRIVELGDLNPGFTNDGFSLLGEKVFYPSKQALFGRGGVNFYEDGNRQYYFYSHYQIPLVDRPVKGIWAAVKPNVYLEWFDLDKSAYFSPSSHATVGGMLHTIWEAEKLRFEVELNPQVQVTEGETAFGGHALADLEWYLTERFSLGAAAFYFLSGSKENSGQFEMWRMLLNGECRF